MLNPDRVCNCYPKKNFGKIGAVHEPDTGSIGNV
jgi:hypothetical protein